MALPPPAQRSISDTRQRLLEAAGEVFAEQGFRTATIHEICRRAGANIAAVHYHFGDKEQLYRALIEYAELCAPDPYPADIPPDSPAEVRLRAHIESFLLQLLDEGRPAWHGKLMAREMFEPGDDVRRCACSVVGQCLFYRHSQPVVTRLFPGVPFGRAQVPELAAVARACSDRLPLSRPLRGVEGIHSAGAPQTSGSGTRRSRDRTPEKPGLLGARWYEDCGTHPARTYSVEHRARKLSDDWIAECTSC